MEQSEIIINNFISILMVATQTNVFFSQRHCQNDVHTQHPQNWIFVMIFWVILRLHRFVENCRQSAQSKLWKTANVYHEETDFSACLRNTCTRFLGEASTVTDETLTRSLNAPPFDFFLRGNRKSQFSPAWIFKWFKNILNNVRAQFQLY